MKNNCSDWKKKLFRKYSRIEWVLKFHRKLFNSFSHYFYILLFVVPQKLFINTGNIIHSQRKIQYSPSEVFMYVVFVVLCKKISLNPDLLQNVYVLLDLHKHP